jgi:hypothetical protein
VVLTGGRVTTESSLDRLALLLPDEVTDPVSSMSADIIRSATIIGKEIFGWMEKKGNFSQGTHKGNNFVKNFSCIEGKIKQFLVGKVCSVETSMPKLLCCLM